jgi:CDP-Glycerol:Poly(glycerophosphate) glycerophosphotransferase
VLGPAGYTPGEPVHAEVVVYFADEPARLYQLRQWLPVFERLDGRHRVLVLTSDASTYAEVREMTELRCVLVPAEGDVVDLYGGGDYKVAVYVNNSTLNFRSLSARRMLHVHLNHGESDKFCMASNQAKAYDRVFVAGQAAVHRYKASLIGFDETKLVLVGRPQLDLRPPAVLPPTDRRTVLYAPTWEDETASNNYTSVDKYGPAIVRAALDLPDVRVVYKPHPRIPLSQDAPVRAAHRQILQLLTEAGHSDSAAGHQALTEGDILAVFPSCDLLITDVSSVGPDFLYLHTDKPLFITDPRNAPEHLHAEVPLSRCADIIDAATITVLGSSLDARLTHDEHRGDREKMRQYYFGDLAAGESTERFLSAIDDAVGARDHLVHRLEAVTDNRTPSQDWQER